MKKYKILTVITFLTVTMLAIAAENPPPVPASALPPPIPVETKYYAVIDGQRSGPYTASELKSMNKNGQIASWTLVWAEGMENWTPISNIAELSTAQDARNSQASDFHDYDTNEDLMIKASSQNSFKRRIGQGVGMAVTSILSQTSGSALLGASVYKLSFYSTLTAFNMYDYLSDSDKIEFGFSIAGTVIGSILLLESVIIGPLCAVPFCKAGRIASDYKKTYKHKLFSALSRTSIDGGYDFENKEVTVAMAIKL